MLPLDRERVRRNLDTLGDRGRADAEARLRRWSEEHPTAPCRRCSGKGCYAERAGARRPFVHLDFDASKGDRYVSSCPACRGFGKVRVTKARAAYLARRELRETRKAYARIRAAVCREQGIDGAHFDRIARKRLRAETPAAWLEAARAVADFLGVEVRRGKAA